MKSTLLTLVAVLSLVDAALADHESGLPVRGMMAILDLIGPEGDGVHAHCSQVGQSFA